MMPAGVEAAFAGFHLLSLLFNRCAFDEHRQRVTATWFQRPQYTLCGSHERVGYRQIRRPKKPGQ
jgi:hypothetical protein